MTPDYVTTGIVSDRADHIEIKDEDLIQKQLQVFFMLHGVTGSSNVFFKVCMCAYVRLLYVFGLMFIKSLFTLLILRVVLPCCCKHRARW